MNQSYRDFKKVTLKDFQRESAKYQIYTVCVSQALTKSKTSEIQLTSVQIDEIILLKKYNNYSDVFLEEEVS